MVRFGRLELDRLLSTGPRDQSILLDFSEDLDWLVLVDCHQTAVLDALLERGRLVLVVVSSPRLFEELVEYYESTRPAGLGLCCQLLGAAAEEVCWFRYNDCRQDGRLPPQELQPLFPNLRLEALEARSLARLDEVVDRWSDQLDTSAGSGGLVVRQEALLPILQGATALLPQLSRLLWWPGEAAPPQAELSAIATLLAPEALVARDSTEPSIRVWERDQRLHLQQALQAATQRIESLQTSSSALAQQHADLQTRLEQLEPLPARFEALEADHRALQQEHQSTAKALQQRQQECRQAAQNLEQARKETEQAGRETEQALADAQRWRGQVDQLQAAMAVAQAEAEQWRLRLERKQTELWDLVVQLDDLRRLLQEGAAEPEATGPLREQLLRRLEAADLEAERRAEERDRIAAESEQQRVDHERIRAECSACREQRELLRLQKRDLQERLQQIEARIVDSEAELESLKTLVLSGGAPAAAGSAA